MVTIITSATDPDEYFAITASPNPANDVINITCAGGSVSVLQLIDTRGKVLISDNTYIAEGAVHRIDLSGLPSGVYYIRITGEGFVNVVPVVKY